MVLARADDADEAVQRILEQIRDNSAISAVHDAWTDHRCAQVRTRRLQDELLVSRPPAEQLPRVGLSRLVHRLRIRS